MIKLVKFRVQMICAVRWWNWKFEVLVINF